MNLLHLRYAVEVSKTKSISKAAENLFMGQPNLSRAIKELEESLGIIIFERSTRGIIVTAAGEEFLQYARRILNQVDEMESLYRDGQRNRQKFSACVPRASYIAEAFVEVASQIDLKQPAEFYYKETNPMHTIDNVCSGDYNLGVVRYQEIFSEYFAQTFAEKNLEYRPVVTFSYLLLMSERSPLAKKENISGEDLQEGIEVLHGDPYIPSLSAAETKRAPSNDFSDKHIYVFERSSQFALLHANPNTYMWVSPIPQRLLDAYHLVQRPAFGSNAYTDVLIYRKDYQLTPFDEIFMAALRKERAQLVENN